MGSRRLLSVAVVGNTLEIDGTGKADRIDVSLPGAGKRIVARLNGARESYLRRGVRAIDIEGCAGNDRIAIAATREKGRPVSARIPPGASRLSSRGDRRG